MPERSMKPPGPDHPIAVTPDARRIVVRVAGRIVADTRHALTLQGADDPAVHYIPRSDVDMTMLEQADRQSYCPYKGDASYDDDVGRTLSTDAVWTYAMPHPAVPQIRDDLAF